MDKEQSDQPRENPDKFTTVYRHDYIPIKAGHQAAVRKHDERTHTVNETDEFLNICDESPPPPPSPIDLANEYMENTFKNAQPKLYKIYMKEPLNQNIIEMELLRDSTYHKDYCRWTKGPMKQKFNITLTESLPLQTTMQDHYRNPYNFGVPPHTLKGPPISILTRNQRVVTSIAKIDNESEYQRWIGATGKFIMDNEMYGKMTYPS